MRRRLAAALVVVGFACMAVAGFGLASPRRAAAAEGDPGSGFASYRVNAEASGVKVLGPDPNIEGFLSHAVSQIRNGPFAIGLASTAWPGRAGGNLGTILLVLGNPACSPPDDRIPTPPECPDIPEEAVLLNSPLRAESRIGSGPGELEVPGATMRADATAAEVTAESLVGAAQAEEIGIQRAVSTTQVTLEGLARTGGEARSVTTGIELGGGVIRIGSIVSSASASTNSATSKAEGSTLVLDASVAGIPVVIDREGVHVAGAGVPTGEAVRGVNEAMSQMGVSIVVSDPILTTEGGSAVASSGSVIVTWAPGGTHVLSVILGGALVTATATPAFSVPGPDDDGDGDDGGFDPGGDGGSVPTSPPDPVTSLTPSPEPSASPDVEFGPVLALAEGVRAGWIALGVIGALLVALGTRRFPELLLTDAEMTCPAEEES